MQQGISLPRTKGRVDCTGTRRTLEDLDALPEDLDLLRFGEQAVVNAAASNRGRPAVLELDVEQLRDGALTEGPRLHDRREHRRDPVRDLLN
jgi:hypothetical protein